MCAGYAERGGFVAQSSTLPVRAEDREILDLVILRAGALEQKVSATLGSKLALEVRVVGWGCGGRLLRFGD